MRTVNEVQCGKCWVAGARREQNLSLLDITSPHPRSTWTTSAHCICSSSEATKPCPEHLLIWSGVATVSTSQVQREWDTVRLRDLPTVSHIRTTGPGVQIQELFFTTWWAWPQKLCCILLLLCSPPPMWDVHQWFGWNMRWFSGPAGLEWINTESYGEKVTPFPILFQSFHYIMKRVSVWC